MYAVASGSITKKGLSPAKAKEYVAGYAEKGLPDRVKKRKTGGGIRMKKRK